MKITNDEKTLITKEERTWPPEHCEVYLVDENNHGIIFVREEKTITIKKHDKEQKIPIDNIIGQCWIPTYEKRIPGKWYLTNVDVSLPKKNIWLYRKHWNENYPTKKYLAVYDECLAAWLIGNSEYNHSELQDDFDYYQIVQEPNDP